MKYGVPEGSRLVPLLIYLSSMLASCSRSSSATYRMCKPLLTIHSCKTPPMPTPLLSSPPPSRPCKTAPRTSGIRVDAPRDRLRLNDGKTEFIIIGTRQQLAKVIIDTLQVGEGLRLHQLAKSRTLGAGSIDI